MARLAEEKAVERVAVAREVDDTERVLHLDRDVLRSREAVKTLNELVLELHETGEAVSAVLGPCRPLPLFDIEERYAP